MDDYKQIEKYLLRGGFIKDRNGALCKEGDTVKFCDSDWDWESAVEGELEYEGNFGFAISGTDCFVSEGYFELLKACEPDVCKNFSGGEE